MGDRPNSTVSIPDPPRAIPRWFFLRRMRAMFFGGIIFTAVGILFGVTCLVLCVRRTRHARMLLTYGAGAEAEVVRKQRVSYIHFGSKSPYDVYYRFHDHYGQEVIGRDRTYHYAWAEALNPGDKVGVVYNPQSSAANVLWLHGDKEPLEATRMSFRLG